MAEPKRVAGPEGYQKSGESLEVADKSSKTLVFEGPYSAFAEMNWDDLDGEVPEGFALARGRLESTGNGMGRLTLNCIEYGSSDVMTAQAIRTTVEIDMEEVTYDLVDHPHLKDVRGTCEKWLATEAAKRFDGEKYYYTDEAGDEQEITEAAALQFCAAYQAGLKNFVRYYPVVQKTSVYKTPPGITRSGRDFSSGSPIFSENIGHFDVPPVSLNAYPNGNWFKNGDSWHERGDGTWERRERWTYTPEGSDGEHAWIYTTIDGEEEE